MTCPACRGENRDAAKFCGACGKTLAVPAACSTCGTPHAPGQRFCDGCGQPLLAPARTQAPRTYTPQHLAEKILTSRTALEGERKQVTVLFADVKGSMELAEQLDPEELHRLMDRFLQLLADGVHRFEGTVNQYTGDGIMALFGAPIAHEDHAQRACWAALHLQETLRHYADELRLSRGLNLSVRMGLNSGEVVVGRIGDDLRMDYTAQGHTVGLAARMEQIAEPGRIYLTAHTARLVDGYFRLRDLGPMAVKGTRAPLGVYELAGVGALRTRLDVSRTRGFSRFVGRDEEMAVLEAALARSLDGNGQVVGVVAEPGVGKSRLCYEFAARCRARGITAHEGHGVAHGRQVPFLPMLEFFRALFGITEQDSERAAREKIAGRLLLLDESLAAALPLVFDFLGVPDPARPLGQMDADARQRRLYATVKHVAQARSRSEPAVLLLEDLHWFDAASEAVLEALVEATAGTRTLLLVNFRPEYHGAWMQTSFYQRLPLQPLGPAAIAELLRDLLGADPSLGDLGERIRARTRGNPFFIEETVLALAEAGTLVGTRGAYRLVPTTADPALPGSVQAVLAARIDRLPAREKEVLQTAAVIGREFDEPLLRRVAGLAEADLAGALRALAAAEFLYETALYPDLGYAFKHPLTQEVALRSQLAERRKRTHAAVARSIEETSAERLDEQAALLAHHWEAAGEAWLAASWHRRAAEWLGPRDRAETLRHWQQVCSLLRQIPESPDTLALALLAHTNVMMNANLLWRLDVSASAFVEAMQLASRLDLPEPRVRLLANRGVGLLFAGETATGLEHLTEARRLADASGGVSARLGARIPLAFALGHVGRLRESIAVAEEAEALAQGDPEMNADQTGFHPLAFPLSVRAGALAYLGRFAEARRDLDRAMAIARVRGDNEVLANCQWHGFVFCELAGDADGAGAHATQMVELAEVIGTPGWRTLALVALGEAQALAGRWREAVEGLRQALAMFRGPRASIDQEPLCLHRLATAYLGAGDLARARETADEAIMLAEKRGSVMNALLGHLVRARVLLAIDGARASAGIAASLDHVADLIEVTGAQAITPFVHVERANLARARGDEAARRRELEDAHRLFSELGLERRAAEVADQLG